MRPRDVLVLDTGPLLDFVVLSYQRETTTQWWKPHVQPHGFATEEERVLFQKLLERSKGRVRTSAGVIAEIQAKVRAAGLQNKCGTTSSSFGKSTWSILRRAFQDWEVSEDLVAFVDMQLPLVVDLGPVDVSLIDLAKRATSEGKRGVVLTNDRTLVARCRREEVSAEFVTDVLREFHAAL